MTGGQRAQLAGEHGVAQQRFAEIVGGVSEGDHVGAQIVGNLIHRAAAVAAAQIAAMVGLVFEQAQRRRIAKIGPGHAALLQIFADGFDGPQKLALLHGERADRKIDRRALLQQQQASSRVAESLPPESATATRSPSRIIWKRWMASPTLRSSVFSRSTDFIIETAGLAAALDTETNHTKQFHHRKIAQEVAMQASVEKPSVASSEIKRPPQSAPRNFAVDTYRGFVMLLMMAEVLQLSTGRQAFPGNHFWACWRIIRATCRGPGCSLHDTIQPGFSFLVGVALPYSIASRSRRGQRSAKCSRMRCGARCC